MSLIGCIPRILRATLLGYHGYLTCNSLSLSGSLIDIVVDSQIVTKHILFRKLFLTLLLVVLRFLEWYLLKVAIYGSSPIEG